MADRVCKLGWTRLREERSFVRMIRLTSFFIVSAVGLVAAHTGLSQETATPAGGIPQVRMLPEREIIWEGLASYGNFRIFATEANTKIYTTGFEYDRHSWGYFAGARMDYVAEFLPVIFFNQLAHTTYYGNPLTPPDPARKILYGMGFSPIGVRMMWRDKRAIKPYLLFKGGMVVFDHKAISDHAAYENFSMESGLGVQARLTERVDLRLGLWGDFHFSDGFLVPINPGCDMMNASWGISYHLAPREAKANGRHGLLRF